MNTRCLNCMQIYDERYEVCPHCGYIRNTPPEELYHLYPGTRLQDRYVIGTVVGFGGFGIIYRAWDERLDTMVAIKEFYPAGIVQRIPGQAEVIVHSGNGRKEFDNGISRFLDEARNMAKFSTHPNIMNVYDFFEENHTAYIVMEFLNGISLKQYVKTMGGKLEIKTAIEIISSVCEALKEIHSTGIIHRDISPDNIFICEDGKIKLIDFGAARFSLGEEEKTLSIILKPGFAPPEQYRSKSKQGPWTDVYALAATLYRIVTGVIPEESVNRIVEDNVQAPEELNSQVTENLSNAIMKGMALNQDLRFQNIEQFQDAILDKKKVTDLKKELKKRKGKRIIGIAAVSVVLLIGGLISYRMFQGRRAEVELPENTVTIWMAVGNEEEVESGQEMLQDMTKAFQEAQPLVHVEVECIPESEYENRLQTAMDNGDMPTIYSSDDISEVFLEQAASVEETFRYINVNDYYFLDDYKNSMPSGKQLPMGYAVPVVYVRRGNGVDIDSAVITGYEQLRTGDGIQYYIEPEAENLFWQSIDGKIYEADSTELQNYHDIYQADLAAANMDIADKTSAMQHFQSGDITYYVGTTQDFRIINQTMAGLYEMRPIESDKITGELLDCFSISGQATEEEQHAASILLAYMLAVGPQKTMHIVHKNAIPLNKQAYEEFVNNNEKYQIITDYYIKNTRFTVQ